MASVFGDLPRKQPWLPVDKHNSGKRARDRKVGKVNLGDQPKDRRMRDMHLSRVCANVYDERQHVNEKGHLSTLDITRRTTTWRSSVAQQDLLLLQVGFHEGVITVWTRVKIVPNRHFEHGRMSRSTDAAGCTP